MYAFPGYKCCLERLGMYEVVTNHIFTFSNTTKASISRYYFDCWIFLKREIWQKVSLLGRKFNRFCGKNAYWTRGWKIHNISNITAKTTLSITICCASTAHSGSPWGSFQKLCCLFSVKVSLTETWQLCFVIGQISFYCFIKMFRTLLN